VTVSEVAVAAVTVPTAPLLRTTVLADAVAASKPVPRMVSVGALMARPARLGDTVGAATTVATTTAAPLDPPKEVTTAVRFPALVGGADSVTVSEVAVAAVTVPTAPLLRTTVLADAVAASKPVPRMVSVGALMARPARLGDTVGAATIGGTFFWGDFLALFCSGGGRVTRAGARV